MFKQQRAAAKSNTALDQAVDQAEETYHSFRAKLKSLISALKAHHAAMLKVNSTQIEAATAIYDLLKNTPLSKYTIGSNCCSETEQGESIEEDEPGEENDSKAGSASSEEFELHLVNVTQIPVKTTTDEPKVIKADEQFKSAGIAHSFGSVIGHDKDIELGGLEESFNAVFNASIDLNQVYTKRYMDWIIRYLEEWDEIISTRIEGRLIQFCQIRHKYVHYTDKVQGLHVKVDRQKEKRAAGARPRLGGKLDRNRLKLSGAEEAHGDLGRGLLSFMEEVTVHYWKDLIPLLHMLIQFSINYSSDLAHILLKLEKTDANLKKISAEQGISMNGRLEHLKPEPIPGSTTVDEVAHEEEKEERDEQDEKGENAGSSTDSQGIESV